MLIRLVLAGTEIKHIPYHVYGQHCDMRSIDCVCVNINGTGL